MAPRPATSLRLPLALSILGTCGGIVVATSRGPAEASSQTVVAVAWALATIYLGCSLAAAIPWRRQGGIGPFTVSLSLLGSAVSIALLASALWKLKVGLDPRAEGFVEGAEGFSRGWFALTLAVCLTPPIPAWLRQLDRKGRSRVWWVASLLALGGSFALGSAMLGPAVAVGGWRTPWVTGVLLVLALIDIGLLARFERREPTRFLRRLLVAMIPWFGVQVLVTAGYSFSDDPTVLGMRLFAICLVFVAVWEHTLEETRLAAIAEEQLSRMRSDLDLQTKELARVDRELERRDASYRELIEGASDIIQSVDQRGGPAAWADGRFLLVNPAWCEALGYSMEESRRMSFRQIVPERLHDTLREQFVALRPGAGPLRREVTFKTRGGAEIELEGVVGGRFEDGILVATLGIFRDVGERRRVERMKREFLATVSHELRTPLTSMMGSLGLLRSGRLAAHPAKAKDLLGIAERNGERLLRLINDLLDLQRLEAGELRFLLTPTSIATVLAEAVQGIVGMSDQLHVRVAIEPSPEGLTVLADRDRLTQVLYNLLSNAIKFSPAGETVTLRAAERDGRAEISVADRGPGIPEAFRARLFEKFAQAETGSPVGGSGLGLSISKRLVEGLGGTIRIDSEEGKGTVVTVSLPGLRTEPAVPLPRG